MQFIPSYLKLWTVTGVFFSFEISYVPRSTPHMVFEMACHMTLHMAHLCKRIVFLLKLMFYPQLTILERFLGS
jgi:hypothetical protein